MRFGFKLLGFDPFINFKDLKMILRRERVKYWGKISYLCRNTDNLKNKNSRDLWKTFFHFYWLPNYISNSKKKEFKTNKSKNL